MTPRTRRTAAALATAAALLSACTVGPDYQRPPVNVPAAYREQEGWRRSNPQDAADRGPWWRLYGDPVLDRLAAEVEISNQNLAAAEAAFRQAQAVVRQTEASQFPLLTVDGSAQRSGQGRGASGGSSVRNQFGVSGGISWDVDLWGRLRRTVESNAASAQASAGDLASARLSAQAELATAYFQLRFQDELQRLLDETVAAYQRSLAIARNRYNEGIAPRSDVVQAETQLQSTQAQAINVGVQRAQLEHAIAVLTGRPPAELSIAPGALSAVVPATPAGVPSTLLERRPDIAAAERRVAAANAEIGVAVAAYFPDLTLSSSYGYSSSQLSNLISSPNHLWSIGAALAATVFDAGIRDAQVEQARAAYDQEVALYRQTVLTAFQEVEDQLAALRILGQQLDVADAAVRSADEAVRLQLDQYQAGVESYTSVITAQTAALSARQSALNVRQNLLVASVALIRALGGGWTAVQLPAVR